MLVSLHSVKWHIISIHPNTDDFHFDHLISVVSAHLLYCKFTLVSPLQLIYILCLETMEVYFLLVSNLLIHINMDSCFPILFSASKSVNTV